MELFLPCLMKGEIQLIRKPLIHKCCNLKLSDTETMHRKGVPTGTIHPSWEVIKKKIALIFAGRGVNFGAIFALLSEGVKFSPRKAR